MGGDEVEGRSAFRQDAAEGRAPAGGRDPEARRPFGEEEGEAAVRIARRGRAAADDRRDRAGDGMAVFERVNLALHGARARRPDPHRRPRLGLEAQQVARPGAETEDRAGRGGGGDDEFKAERRGDLLAQERQPLEESHRFDAGRILHLRREEERRSGGRLARRQKAHGRAPAGDYRDDLDDRSACGGIPRCVPSAHRQGEGSEVLRGGEREGVRLRGVLGQDFPGVLAPLEHLNSGGAAIVADAGEEKEPGAGGDLGGEGNILDDRGKVIGLPDHRHDGLSGAFVSSRVPRRRGNGETRSGGDSFGDLEERLKGGFGVLGDQAAVDAEGDERDAGLIARLGEDGKERSGRGGGGGDNFHAGRGVRYGEEDPQLLDDAGFVSPQVAGEGLDLEERILGIGRHHRGDREGRRRERTDYLPIDADLHPLYAGVVLSLDLDEQAGSRLGFIGDAQLDARRLVSRLAARRRGPPSTPSPLAAAAGERPQEGQRQSESGSKTSGRRRSRSTNFSRTSGVDKRS